MQTQNGRNLSVKALEDTFRGKPVDLTLILTNWSYQTRIMMPQSCTHWCEGSCLVLVASMPNSLELNDPSTDKTCLRTLNSKEVKRDFMRICWRCLDYALCKDLFNGKLSILLMNVSPLILKKRLGLIV